MGEGEVAAGEALLLEWEAQVRKQPGDVSVSSQYRAQCRNLGVSKRAAEFFKMLLPAHPRVRNLRLQLAMAYVDQITLGGTMVAKALLAHRSLDQLNQLVAADSTWWPAVYARAMNHLHWPTYLQHADDAAADFERCLRVQSDAGGLGMHAYYVRTFVGLGDARVQLGAFAAAQEVWRQGLQLFPGHPELEKRLLLPDADAARAFVHQVRNLNEDVDTDLSFLSEQ
jgi:hypothetical protein